MCRLFSEQLFWTVYFSNYCCKMCVVSYIFQFPCMEVHLNLFVWNVRNHWHIIVTKLASAAYQSWWPRGSLSACCEVWLLNTWRQSSSKHCQTLGMKVVSSRQVACWVWGSDDMNDLPSMTSLWLEVDYYLSYMYFPKTIHFKLSLLMYCLQSVLHSSCMVFQSVAKATWTFFHFILLIHTGRYFSCSTHAIAVNITSKRVRAPHSWRVATTSTIWACSETLVLHYTPTELETWRRSPLSSIYHRWSPTW